MTKRHQPHIEASVAIENVAEFVGNDALQFIAREQFQAAERHANGHTVPALVSTD